MPVKISLEISESSKKEIDALICFLTVCGAGIPSPSDETPEPSDVFKVAEEIVHFGPTLVPDHPSASAPVTVASAAPATDKSGLPWDERIHASTRALTADGMWRKKRGVEDATVNAVEAQLRQVMNIPAPAAPPPPPPAPVPVEDFQNKFVALIGRTAQALAAGKITQAQIQQCADSAGLPNIQMLFNRPDLFEQVRAALDAIIGV